MELTFKLTAETRVSVTGETLYRIEAIKDIPSRYVKKGDKGGFVSTLKVYGDARVSGNAWVSGNAQVYGDARVSGNAWVSGNAQVYGNARVYGDARVSGDAQVSGNARVYGDAWVYGDAVVDSIAAILWITVAAFYTITITRKYVFIGCQTFKRSEVKRLTQTQAIEKGCPKNLFKPLKAMTLEALKIVKEKE